ncbi:hypothetical protein F8388_023129 [Cannabis sativa]|uniref:Asparaginase n=1 Tax=Cannabis sativa TaxID=3483 RepID=A0A7J6FM71_CANSA|nr:hypothetical protein F8388_023129 [Cannabis sativa]
MTMAIALHGGAGDMHPSFSLFQQSVDSHVRMPFITASRLALKLSKQESRGFVLTCNGDVEMEASIRDGNTKNCEVVSGLKTVVNALSLPIDTPLLLIINTSESIVNDRGRAVLTMSLAFAKEAFDVKAGAVVMANYCNGL